MDLADDPKTLSISTGPTFRQKGEAFYSQLCRHYIPRWMFECIQNAHVYGQGFYYAGTQNMPQAGPSGIMESMLGGIGSAGASIDWRRQ